MGDAASLTQQKMDLEARIAQLEHQIYNLERSYLEITADSGNVLRGWTDYLTAGPLRSKQAQHARKHKFSESDRLFSLSSVTSPASRNLEAAGAASATTVAAAAPPLPLLPPLSSIPLPPVPVVPPVFS